MRAWGGGQCGVSGRLGVLGVRTLCGFHHRMTGRGSLPWVVGVSGMWESPTGTVPHPPSPSPPGRGEPPLDPGGRGAGGDGGGEAHDARGHQPKPPGEWGVGGREGGGRAGWVVGGVRSA